MTRVPLVVVTGFLGAGKTTLVNQLLANRAARGATSKLGIIVNELGEIGIDGALLGSGTTRQIELPGGCVCCVLGPELDQTLLDVVRDNPGLEAMVLETTGVAEPLPIAWAVRREPVASQVRLAAVVTLVDATNFRRSRGVSVSVDAQVQYADVLLVTKSQVAGDAETAAVIAAAQELAPKAIVRVGTTEDHVSWLEQVLADPDLERPTEEAHAGATAARDAAAAARDAAPPSDHDHADHDHHAGHDHAGCDHAGDDHAHVHDANCRTADSRAHGIDSVWLDVEGPVDVEELEDQLAELPPNYVRIKGIVRDSGGGWVAIHCVGVRASSEPFVREPDEMLGRHGRLVALGSELSREKLAQALRASYAAGT